MELDRVSNERVYDHIYNGGFTRVNVPHNHCVIICCRLCAGDVSIGDVVMYAGGRLL